MRFESSLPKDILECVIITVAHRWKSEFEWKIHSGLAIKAGVPEEVVSGLAEGASVARFPQAYRMVVEFCQRALEGDDVGDTLFGEMRSMYGLQGVLELLSACGYYGTLAMILTTARITE